MKPLRLSLPVRMQRGVTTVEGGDAVERVAWWDPSSSACRTRRAQINCDRIRRGDLGQRRWGGGVVSAPAVQCLWYGGKATVVGVWRIVDTQLLLGVEFTRAPSLLGSGKHGEHRRLHLQYGPTGYSRRWGWRTVGMTAGVQRSRQSSLSGQLPLYISVHVHHLRPGVTVHHAASYRRGTTSYCTFSRR